MLKRILEFIVLTFIMVTLASCGGGHNGQNGDGKEAVEIRYATDLKLLDHDGYREAVVRNPWDTTKVLHRYFLVSRDGEIPSLPADGTVVRVPVKKALIYATVHNSLVKELGAFDAIGGVCNSEYINDADIKSRIKSGKIVDCGNSMSPTIEKIIALRPEIIMLSPFENNDNYAKVGELGIPIIECADYMETSPLGRAEWVKFYGMLFGKDSVAQKMFDTTEKNYLALRQAVAKTSSRPEVIVDQRYGQVWNVPGGESTMGILIRDAGAKNPFDKYNQSGSVPLAPEKVLAEAHDADIWFVRYFQDNPKTLAELAADAPVNSRFKAFREGNVWGCNTSVVDFYEEVPYHPDWILADMISIIHPEIKIPASTHHYYEKMR